MAKNTPKLTAEQRDERKFLKKQLLAAGGAMFTYPDHGIVVVVVPAVPNRLDSEFVRFAVAQCSKDDKFRVKVGQYLALDRWFNEQTMSRRTESGGQNIDMNLENEADTIAWFFGAS